MSMQSFQTFMTRINEDAALRDELRSKAPEGMSMEQLAKEAAARGFAFDATEVTGQMSDADLDTVAGGGEWKTSASPFAAFKFGLVPDGGFKLTSIFKF